nr:MAG TPA: hypothetical protein [Caudoviricetes sp.]
MGHFSVYKGIYNNSGCFLRSCLCKCVQYLLIFCTYSTKLKNIRKN